MQITKENLTIIIVTIKSQNIIDECLKSIGPEVKKIVVENSTNQNFGKYLKENYKNIECYVTGENLGMGSANNIGINKSKTRYVMILNPDTRLNSETLSQIFKISKDLEFAILTPISDNINYPNYKIYKQYSRQDQDLFEVDQIDGYSMILDKNQFNNDFFDEKIFMYLENDDLCLRIKKKNKKIFVYRNSLISHLGAKTVDQKYFNELEFSRNWHWNWSKFYFKKKHYGFIRAFLPEFFVFIKSIFKCAFFFLFHNNFKCKKYFYRASGFFNAVMNKRSWFRPRLD